MSRPSLEQSTGSRDAHADVPRGSEACFQTPGTKSFLRRPTVDPPEPTPSSRCLPEAAACRLHREGECVAAPQAPGRGAGGAALQDRVGLGETRP